MPAQTVRYEGELGTSLVGAIACPTHGVGPFPAVLVVHDAFGIGKHTIERAERLAEMGYVALAVDMFGDGRACQTIQEGLELVNEVASDPKKLAARISAAAATLKAQGNVDPARLGAIGFCFGGTVVLEFARSGAAVQAVCSFHGTLATKRPAAKGMSAGVLICHGDSDPLVPPEQVAAFCEEMRAAEADWQLEIYGGVKHGFTKPEADAAGIPALSYNANADRSSWNTMAQFMRRRLIDA